jgi:hypothetical protein
LRFHHRGTVARVILAAVCAVGGAVALAGPAAAAEGATLGIAPADEPDFFHVELTAGGMTRRTALVSNNSKVVQQIAIYPADGLNTPQGGFAVKAVHDRRTGVAAWTRMPLSTLTLPAGGHQRVTFELRVPAGTSPGDYTGGIVAQSQPRTGQTGEVRGGTAVRLNLVERVVARIYLNVAGTARPALTVGSLTGTADGSRRTFTVSVRNNGNMRLQPTGALRITGWPGATTSVPLSSVDTLLPGEQAVLRVEVAEPAKIFWGNAVATIRSEAPEARSATPLRVLPIVPFVGAIGILLALGWGLIRVLRYLRRASSALRGEPVLIAGRHRRLSA